MTAPDQKSLALHIAALCVCTGVALEVISVFPWGASLNNPREVAGSLMGTGLSLGFGVSVSRNHPPPPPPPRP